MDWRQFANFTPAEFTCRCGCGREEMDVQFMHAIQSLRTSLGFALPITSGFRCPDYNSQVSTTGAAGPHTTGKAADVRVFGSRAFEVLALAPEFNFTGFGVKQKGPHGSRFLHLDTIADGPRPWVWSY